MKATTLLPAALLLAATASAHAEGPHGLVVGGAVGPTRQAVGILFDDEVKATLVDVQLHAGYRTSELIEIGADLEVGNGSGLRSIAALAELKFHIYPTLYVNPTITLGVGPISEHGTHTGDAYGGIRTAFVGGFGLEKHIQHWRVSVDLRFMATPDGADDEPYGTMYRATRDRFGREPIFAASARAGVAYEF